MLRFLIVRLGQSVLTLVFVSVIIFALVRLSGSPTDVLIPESASPEAADRIAHLWGLDKPVLDQYVIFASNALRGDLGESLKYQGEPALRLVLERFLATLELAAVALVIATLLAVPIGVMSAYRKGGWLDTVGRGVALLGQSAPPFWVGIVLIWVFAVRLRLLPTSGSGSWQQLVLPALVLGWFPTAALMRLVRSAMLTALDSEYVKLARAKGLPEWKVLWKHAFKNAAIPPLTYFGIMVGRLLAGSVAVESVFAWPGVGLLALNSVSARDYQVVQAIVIVVSVTFIAVNLAVDLAYAYLDPRVRSAWSE